MLLLVCVATEPSDAVALSEPDYGLNDIVQGLAWWWGRAAGGHSDSCAASNNCLRKQLA